MQQIAQQWATRVHALCGHRGVTLNGRLTAIRSSQVLTLVATLADPKHLKQIMGMGEELALHLGVPAVRIGRSLGYVHFEIPLPRDHHRTLTVQALGQIVPRESPTAVPVGKSVLNRPVTIDMTASTTPHALVAGQSGSGKSVFLQTLVTQIARAHRPDAMRMILIDAKADTFDPFRGLAHLAHPVVDDTAEGATILAWALDEMKRRKTSHDRTPVLIIIDEIAELIAEDGANGKAAEALGRLCSAGRGLGLHVVMATQHPTAAVIGGSISRANVGARFVARVTDSRASALALGLSEQNAHQLGGRGDILFLSPEHNGSAQRFQAAVSTPAVIRSLPRLSPGQVPHIDLDPFDIAQELENSDQPHPSQMPDPLDPAQVAWAMANRETGDVPGLNRIRQQFSIGATKAQRVQEFARDTVAALHDLGKDVIDPCEPSAG